jgi:predicted metalloendopeptidase
MKIRCLPSLLAAALALASTAPAALEVGHVDRAADACTDFYRFANGRWLDEVRIPEDRTRWGTFDEIEQRNEEILVEALDRAVREGLPGRGTPQRMAIEFYASGMDLEAIEKAGIAPVEPLLASAGAVNKASLARTLAELHASGIDAGFDITARPDARDSSRWLAQLVQDGLGLPERDYYFLDDARSVQIRDAYRKHVERMFMLAGDGAGPAARNAGMAIAIEVELARGSMNAVERRDAEKTYNKMPVARLAELAPGFPWREYLEAAGAGSLDQVNVAQTEFAKTFARLAATKEAADWQAYLRWHVLRETASKLPRAFARAHFDFHETLLRGRKVEPPRARQVIDVIGGRTGTEPMGQALSRVYLDRAFSVEAKERAMALVTNVKAALADRLATLDWMGDDTRRRALDKLAAMGVKIAYPDLWRDYSGADVGPHPFAANWINAKRFWHHRVVERIGQPVNRAEWFSSPHITNAFYNSSGNEIVFPAGILQPPFFDAKADDPANYGAIGMVIGHEITHGFDDRGRRFDAVGNMIDWWTAEDARRYLERAQRVERQYGAFVGVEDIKVNGKLTLGENISDVGGLKIAYLALQKALEGRPRDKVEGLTPEQRFFVSFAQAWRSSYRPEMERLQLRTDAHSPPRFRVAGVLANMPEFAQAFGCDARRALLADGDRANIW